MVCSNLTFAFASMSPSKFNIASMETQTQTQMHRMGLNPFMTFYITLNVDANANIKCEQPLKAHSHWQKPERKRRFCLMIVKFPLDFVFTIAFTWSIFTVDLYYFYSLVLHFRSRSRSPPTRRSRSRDRRRSRSRDRRRSRSRERSGRFWGKVREKCESDQRLWIN